MLNQLKVRKEAQAGRHQKTVWESPDHSVPETMAQNPDPMPARRRQLRAQNRRAPMPPKPQLPDEYTLPVDNPH